MATRLNIPEQRFAVRQDLDDLAAEGHLTRVQFVTQLARFEHIIYLNRRVQRPCPVSTETTMDRRGEQASMTQLARKFADVERGHIVILAGYPETGEESEWHVNTAAVVGAGANERKAIILQAADVGERWITVALERTGNTWSIGEFAAFEGEPPSGMSDESAIPIDPSDVDLVRIET